MINESAVTEFYLIGFPLSLWLQAPFSFVCILMYVFIIFGNIMIIMLVGYDPKLHMPMYFFLANFSFLEVWFTTIVVPRMIRDLIMVDKSIGFVSCIFQFYFVMVCGGNEHYLLAVLAYDRFMAICYPLYYNIVMKPKTCVRLIVGSWLMSFLAPVFTSISLYKRKYCGVNLDHFFCDIAPILQNMCEGREETRFIFYMLSAIIVLTGFTLICISYIFIVVTVLRIKSNEGRRNAFFTCSSHLTVVTIFYIGCIFMYVRPYSNTLFDTDKLVSLTNTLVAPVLNPIIYTFRNKAMKTALKKCLNLKKVTSWFS